MKLTIIVLLAAVVNLMVSADVTSDDNVAKGLKREAPMAEPSTDYTPPRLEAPYATYSPIIAGGNAPQPSFYQQNPFNQGPSNQRPFNQESFSQGSFNQGPPNQGSFNQGQSSATPYEYSRYTGVIPLQSVEGNELGNGLNPGPPYSQGYGSGNGYSGGTGYSGGNRYPGGNGYSGGNGYNGATNSYGSFAKYGQNSQGNPATSYAQLNGLGQSLTVYGGSGNNYDNNPGGYEQYSTIKGSFNGGNAGDNFENSFYGNPSFGGSPDSKFPSSAALVSNEPVYASGIKGLRHYTQPQSSLNTQALKNSRPVALTPPHLTRKQPSFLQSTEPRNPNFRPSFLLGSSVLSSTPDYNQPQLTSLGETSYQYIPPQQLQQYFPQSQNIPDQYSAPPSLGSLPLQGTFNQAQPNFANGYQTSESLGQAPPSTSYGLPETIIYTKSSLYGERYGQTH